MKHYNSQVNIEKCSLYLHNCHFLSVHKTGKVRHHNTEFYGLKIVLLTDTMFDNKFCWHCRQPTKPKQLD